MKHVIKVLDKIAFAGNLLIDLSKEFKHFDQELLLAELLPFWFKLKSLIFIQLFHRQNKRIKIK